MPIALDVLTPVLDDHDVSDAEGLGLLERDEDEDSDVAGVYVAATDAVCSAETDGTDDADTETEAEADPELEAESLEVGVTSAVADTLGLDVVAIEGDSGAEGVGTAEAVINALAVSISEGAAVTVGTALSDPLEDSDEAGVTLCDGWAETDTNAEDDAELVTEALG